MSGDGYEAGSGPARGETRAPQQKIQPRSIGLPYADGHECVQLHRRRTFTQIILMASAAYRANYDDEPSATLPYAILRNRRPFAMYMMTSIPFLWKLKLRASPRPIDCQKARTYQ